MCTANFDKGLKPHITKPAYESGDEKLQMDNMNSHNMINPPTRMEID